MADETQDKGNGGRDSGPGNMADETQDQGRWGMLRLGTGKMGDETGYRCICKR